MSEKTETEKHIRVTRVPIAKFVFSDIVEKAKKWSALYPSFKEGLDEGYKNPSSCFRQTGDGTGTGYENMVKDMKDTINSIAGSGWGETYNNPNNPEELEQFRKLYRERFGSLGLESILFGMDGPRDDGIACEQSAGGGGSRPKRCKSRRSRCESHRTSRRKSRQQP